MNKYWSSMNIANIFLLSPSLKVLGCSHSATSVKMVVQMPYGYQCQGWGCGLEHLLTLHNTLGWIPRTIQKGRTNLMSYGLCLEGGLLHM